MQRPSYDVGVIVPLAEEFRCIIEIAPQLEAISHDGSFFYVLQFDSISVVAHICGQMGTLPALQATTKLLAFTDVKVLVVLGLGGALGSDVSVGDIVVAEEVAEFQANSKAETTGDTYTVRHSGRHWPLDYRIRKAIENFEFACSEGFSKWRADVAKDYQELAICNKEAICSERPQVHLGPIASGNTVAASAAYVGELKKINRKFAAIDMEAAGVALAASERIHPIPCLVVRGISDNANEYKKDLDASGEGAWRKYCIRNATSFLKYLFSWDVFQNACGISSQVPTDSWALAAKVATGLRSCTGGCWLVGIAFDCYSQGPSVINTQESLPVDISRLRVADPRFAELVDAAARAKIELVMTGDTGSAITRFTALALNYRQHLNSPAADTLLSDFDSVVHQLLCPSKDDDSAMAIILEADRLEEEVGPEAVIALLTDLADSMPKVRERLVETYASLNRWADVAATLDPLDLNTLSRSELENLVAGHVKLSRIQEAIELLSLHSTKYQDNAAQLFRRHLKMQHSQLCIDSESRNGQ